MKPLILLGVAGVAVATYGVNVWAYRPAKVTDEFHRLYYSSADQTWRNTRFLGVEVAKNPFDLWTIQEIIHDTKPDLIIECGTFKGGSAYFMARLLDLLGSGRVITIDIEHPEGLPRHQRIEYLLGSSTAPEIVEKVQAAAAEAKVVLVLLDSDHRKAHVDQELVIYSKLVTLGSYLILEDTNVNGHPVYPSFGPGPMEALEDFRPTEKGFQIDKAREKFFMTFNPNGYLRRIAQ